MQMAAAAAAPVREAVTGEIRLAWMVISRRIADSPVRVVMALPVHCPVLLPGMAAAAQVEASTAISSRRAGLEAADMAVLVT